MATDCKWWEWTKENEREEVESWIVYLVDWKMFDVSIVVVLVVGGVQVW